MKAGGNFFGKYDYGVEENQRRYNESRTPPAFNLEAVTVPLYIFYGNGDKLVAPEDVKTLAETLPSTEAIYQIDYEGWNHNDFVYAIHAKNLVYDIIIQHMEEKEKETIIADHDGSYSYNYEWAEPAKTDACIPKQALFLRLVRYEINPEISFSHVL